MPYISTCQAYEISVCQFPFILPERGGAWYRNTSLSTVTNRLYIVFRVPLPLLHYSVAYSIEKDLIVVLVLQEKSIREIPPWYVLNEVRDEVTADPNQITET